MLHFSVRNFRIDGPSMHPTLIDEQHVIVSKVAYLRFTPSAQPDYGDVIAFAYPKDPSRHIVKRVIGLPGDVIEIVEGQVIRNGKRLSEPHVTHLDGRDFAPVQVPPAAYYVLGDNRRMSTDSRAWGFVREEDIIGRAWLSYWPSDRFEFLQPLW